MYSFLFILFCGKSLFFLRHSLEGNRFLCNSSVIRGCSDMTAVTNGNCFAICHSISFFVLDMELNYEHLAAGTMTRPPQKGKNYHQLALTISLSITCATILALLFVYWLSYCRWRLPFAFASAGNHPNICCALADIYIYIYIYMTF
jgi:hypothetical protein